MAADPTEFNDRLSFVTGLFAQLARGGMTWFGIFRVNHAGRHFQGELFGAEAVLADQEDFTGRCHRHNVNPFRRLQYIKAVL